MLKKNLIKTLKTCLTFNKYKAVKGFPLYHHLRSLAALSGCGLAAQNGLLAPQTFSQAVKLTTGSNCGVYLANRSTDAIIHTIYSCYKALLSEPREGSSLQSPSLVHTASAKPGC